MMNDLSKSLSASRTARLAACAALFLGALAVSPLHAQDAPPQQGEGRPSPAEMQQRQLDRMTKMLNLTPDQVSQVKAIQTDSRTKAEAIRSDSTIAQPDKRTRMMAVRTDEQGKIRALLTADQQTNYDAMIARQQERGGGRGGYGGQGTPPPSL